MQLFHRTRKSSFFLKTNWLKFIFIFCILFVITSPNGFLPLLENFFNWYLKFFQQFFQWCLKHIFHSDKILQSNDGSGDTLYDYFMLGFVLFLSAIGTLLWNWFGKETDQKKLIGWLNVLLRYFLSFTMFEYGIVKLLNLQFLPPSPYRLIEPYGNSSPMGLAWTFFGYSTFYNYFLGASEVLAGTLLLWRRTRRIGYLITLILSMNITIINYCFDICVKLFSTVMTLMSAFLFIEDSKHHVDYFFHKPRQSATEVKMFNNELRFPKWATVLKYVLIVYVIGGNLYSGFKSHDNNYPKPENIPLYGVYDAEVFIRNRDTIPPLITDTTRWRKLTISRQGGAVVLMMNDSLKRFVFRVDTVNKKINAYLRSDTLDRWSLSYRYDTQKHLYLSGTSKKDSVTILLRPFDLNRFLLISRHSQLVTEQPFNY